MFETVKVSLKLCTKNGRFGAKSSKSIVLIGKPLIFFWHGFIETRSIEIGGFTYFWSKNLKPVVVSLKPEILAKPKFYGFNEYHHGVSSFYPQKHVNTAIFDRLSFTEYLSKKLKKKYERVSYETILLAI